MSDRIGCMSPANAAYVIKNNPEINPVKIEICPNSIEIQEETNEDSNYLEIKKGLGIQNGMRVFIYGGNLGKPQGIDFLIKLLDAQCNSKDSFFIIIGSGTQYPKLEKWYCQKKPENIILKPYLPKKDYDKYVQISDIGLIFLDYNFSIPNYPSRLLSYLESKKPILAITDINTDIGPNAESEKYGFWSPSNDVDIANKSIQKYCSMTKDEIEQMGTNGYNYLKEHFTVALSYNIIMNNKS
ncbi:MAG: hypothetical protein ACJA1A_003739 [Saprospiraceae bacterium]